MTEEEARNENKSDYMQTGIDTQALQPSAPLADNHQSLQSRSLPNNNNSGQRLNLFGGPPLLAVGGSEKDDSGMMRDDVSGHMVQPPVPFMPFGAGLPMGYGPMFYPSYSGVMPGQTGFQNTGYNPYYQTQGAGLPPWGWMPVPMGETMEGLPQNQQQQILPYFIPADVANLMTTSSPSMHTMPSPTVSATAATNEVVPAISGGGDGVGDGAGDAIRHESASRNSLKPVQKYVQEMTDGKLRNRKAHSCPIEGCNFSTFKVGSIRSHIFMHTGERPYKCSFPDCNFSLQSTKQYKIT